MIDLNPSVEDVLALGWRDQAVGKKEELLARLRVINDYIDAVSAVVDTTSEQLSTAPIDQTTAALRIGLAVTKEKLTRAQKAQRVLTKELGRRGVVVLP